MTPIRSSAWFISLAIKELEMSEQPYPNSEADRCVARAAVYAELAKVAQNREINR